MLQHHAVMSGNQTTSNCAEAQNKNLQERVGEHPSVFGFSERLKTVIGSSYGAIHLSTPSKISVATLQGPDAVCMGLALEEAESSYAALARDSDTDEAGSDDGEEDDGSADDESGRDDGEESDGAATDDEDESGVRHVRPDPNIESTADEDEDFRDIDEFALHVSHRAELLSEDPSSDSDDSLPGTYTQQDSLPADGEADAGETETARVKFLMREMRKGRGERRQRALQPTLIRHILSRYPDHYLKRRPSPRLALLKDLTTAIDKRPYAHTANDE